MVALCRPASTACVRDGGEDERRFINYKNLRSVRKMCTLWV
jgi:hypothetical protein